MCQKSLFVPDKVGFQKYLLEKPTSVMGKRIFLGNH